MTPNLKLTMILRKKKMSANQAENYEAERNAQASVQRVVVSGPIF